MKKFLAAVLIMMMMLTMTGCSSLFSDTSIVKFEDMYTHKDPQGVSYTERLALINKNFGPTLEEMVDTMAYPDTMKYDEDGNVVGLYIYDPESGMASGWMDLTTGEVVEEEVELGKPDETLMLHLAGTVTLGSVIYGKDDQTVYAYLYAFLSDAADQQHVKESMENVYGLTMEAEGDKVLVSKRDAAAVDEVFQMMESMYKVQTVLMQQLKELADKGLDHQQLEAVMANQEFRMRERDYGYYPQGIIFGFSVLESWLYGGDPAANLEVGDLFVRLREKMQQGYFEQLIRDLLLENPHSARVVLKPSSSAGEERRAKEQARLEKETSAWTEAESEAVAARQEKLLAWQESQDTPETLATIPQLSLEDIPAQPEQIPTEVTEIAGIPVIKHELHAGGIAYVRLYFDANSCTEEELSCLQFASSLLGNMDTSDHSAAEIVNRTRLLCGEFKAKLMASASEEEPEHASTRLCIFFSALESKLAEAMDHVTEILTQSRFDEASVHDMLRQGKMEAFQKITMAAHAVSIHRISAQTSPVSVVTDRAEGVSYYQWLKAADDQWNFAQMKEQMGELLQRVIRRGGLTISIGGAAAANASMLAEHAAQLLPNAAAKANVCIKPWGKRKEGIVIPGDVAYAGLGGSVKACGGEYSGQMQLASQMISLGYLWNVIRVQNGAYGTGMVAQNRGEVLCYSYRDPNGAASLKAYRESAAFLREFAAGTEDFTGFIIGAVAGASPLMTPNTKAKVADEWYFNQNTWEKRCLRRQQMLNATAEDLQALADVIEKTLSDGGVCLIGGQTQLEKCDELDNIITL